MDLRKIHSEIHKNKSGGTIFDWAYPDCGYIVASNLTEKVNDKEQVLEIAEAHGLGFGWWHDQQTGIMHYDAVYWVQDREKAICLGLKENQIAIWDVENNCEIYLKELI